MKYKYFSKNLQIIDSIRNIWYKKRSPMGSAFWPEVCGKIVGNGNFFYSSEVIPQRFSLHFITKGEGTLRVANTELRLKAGDLFTVWPGLPFEINERKGSCWEYIFTEFCGDGAGAFIRSLGLADNELHTRLSNSKPLHGYFNDLLDLYSKQETGTEAQVFQCCYAISSVCGAENKIKKNRLNEKPYQPSLSEITEIALDLMKSQYKFIQCSDIPPLLKISPSTMTRAFRKSLNKTPTRCLQDIKINIARAYLENNPHLKLSKVAAESGFQSDKYLMRKFKEAYQCTPAEFRRQEAEKVKSKS